MGNLCCKENIIVVPATKLETGPNIVLIRPAFDSINYWVGGSYKNGDWSGHTIYCAAPLRKLTLNDDLEVVQDTILELFKRYRFISLSKSNQKLLAVHSLYSDASDGSLYLLDAATGKGRLVRDSLYYVSSARFWGCDQKCIYYTYGNPSRQIVPGYYSLDLESDADSLLFSFTSEVGPIEVINGFDISPDNQRLLIPINHYVDFPGIKEVNLKTGSVESLKVDFRHQLLWLRYNPAGSKIVYSNYPRGSGGEMVSDTSEMGVIDRGTLMKRILNSNTRPPYHSITVFPNWSSDGLHIVYGSAPGPFVEPPGFIGEYSLYVLKTIK